MMDRERLDALLHQYLELRDRGTQPTRQEIDPDLTVEEWAELQPGLALLDRVCAFLDLGSAVDGENPWATFAEDRVTSPSEGPGADGVQNPRLARPARMPDVMPRTIGRYQVEAVIDRGGFGVVYRARDPKLNRLVAIKVLRPERLQRGGRDSIEGLKAEALRLAQFKHENIVEVYDVVDNDETRPLAVVMEYVAGKSLKTMIQERKQAGSWFEVGWVVDVMIPLARALEYAHTDRGSQPGQFAVIHCDLKPANVMIAPDGKPVLLDFGISVDRDRQEAEPLSLVGTLPYMSPEQLRGGRGGLGPTSDVWSLGVVLYELLTGELPFASADTRSLLKKIEERPSSVAPSTLSGSQRSPGAGGDLPSLPSYQQSRSLSNSRGAGRRA